MMHGISLASDTRAGNRKLAARSLGAVLVLGLLLSCSGAKADSWPQPADEAALKRLEERSLALAESSDGISGFRRNSRREERSRLLFLLGQEQLGRWIASLKSGSSADRNDEAARAALGAFERVVDLGGELVPSARHNIEFIAASMENAPEQPGQQDQQGQQSDQQDQESGQQDSQGAQDQQEAEDQKNQEGQNPQDGEQNPGEQKLQDSHGAQDSQSGQDQGAQPQDMADPAGQDTAAPERDLSGLVKDRADDGALEEALEAALAREREKQQAQAGTMPPVVKDW